MNQVYLIKRVFAGMAVFCIMLNGNSQKISQTTENAPRKPHIPANIKALITRTLEQPCESLNTDWFGTVQAEAILMWAKKGYPEGTQYVENWLNYHIELDNKLSDEEYLNTYSGNKARIIREGVLPFSLYAGTIGVSFPCFTLYQQTKNANARNVCITVADAILHYSARDRFGYMGHDDFNYFKWCIPDVGYFSVRVMADASALVDEGASKVYLKNAYTRWAIPAEQKQLEMAKGYYGFIPGMVMMAAAQILK
jgi:hypothetical protein